MVSGPLLCTSCLIPCLVPTVKYWMQDNSKQIGYCHVLNGCWGSTAFFSSCHLTPVKPGHVRLLLGKSQCFWFLMHLGLPLFVVHCSFVFIRVMQDFLKRILVSIRQCPLVGYKLFCTAKEKNWLFRKGKDCDADSLASVPKLSNLLCLAQATYTKVRHPQQPLILW